MNLDRKHIRPIIKGINSILNKSVEEEFQNQTLRPIIKLQHELLIAHFRAYLVSKKCNFRQFTQVKQEAYIAVVFLKDNSYKFELKGIVIGQFTTDEFAVYSTNKSDFNKRILTMIKQRIISVCASI